METNQNRDQSDKLKLESSFEDESALNAAMTFTQDHHELHADADGLENSKDPNSVYQLDVPDIDPAYKPEAEKDTDIIEEAR